MGIFGTEALNEELRDNNELVEMMLVDEISRLDSDTIHKFCESAEAEALIEANVLRKPTLVRLGKKDDAKRRKKLAAFRLAKENKDPNWAKLCKNRIQEKKLINAIMQRWGQKAEREAKIAQQMYIKTAGKTTANFKKMGGDAR